MVDEPRHTIRLQADPPGDTDSRQTNLDTGRSQTDTDIRYSRSQTAKMGTPQLLYPLNSIHSQATSPINIQSKTSEVHGQDSYPGPQWDAHTGAAAVIHTQSGSSRQYAHNTPFKGAGMWFTRQTPLGPFTPNTDLQRHASFHKVVAGHVRAHSTRLHITSTGPIYQQPGGQTKPWLSLSPRTHLKPRILRETRAMPARAPPTAPVQCYEDRSG